MWTRLVTELLMNGWSSQCGATGLNRIVLFGTAAEFSVVPLEQAVRLPESVPMEQGACLGIPGITGHRAVHVAGPVEGRTVLVQGGAGAVSLCAIQLARRAGAYVITTIRSSSDESGARSADPDEILLTGENLIERVRALVPEGVDHIVEVAFGANIATDIELLAPGGSLATYGSDVAFPEIPVWHFSSWPSSAGANQNKPISSLLFRCSIRTASIFLGQGLEKFLD
jgi:NADPH:quinone reductase-like Zn-dependent oxidoreductase